MVVRRRGAEDEGAEEAEDGEDAGGGHGVLSLLTRTGLFQMTSGGELNRLLYIDDLSASYTQVCHCFIKVPFSSLRVCCPADFYCQFARCSQSLRTLRFEEVGENTKQHESSNGPKVSTYCLPPSISRLTQDRAGCVQCSLNARTLVGNLDWIWMGSFPSFLPSSFSSWLCCSD